MGLWIIGICSALLVLYVGATIQLSRARKQRWANYQGALAALVANPSNAQHRVAALEAGRTFFAAENKGVLTQMDEVRAEELMKEAQRICRTNFGPASTVYQLDYFKWRVVCTEH